MPEKRGIKAKELLRSLSPYYGRYRKILIFDLFYATLTILGELILLLMLRYVADQGIQDLTSMIAGVVIRVGGLYLLLRTTDSLAAYYMAYTRRIVGVHIETDMRQDAFERSQVLSDGCYSSIKVRQIMSCITSDLFDVMEFVHHRPKEFFITVLKAVVSFIIPPDISPELTLFIFVLVPIITISCTWLNLKVKEAFRRQRDQVGELNAQIEDILLDNRMVRAFANEPVETARFGRGNQDSMDIKKYTHRYMAALQITTGSSDGLMYMAVAVVRGIFMIQGKMEPEDLVAYTIYVTALLATIHRTIEFVKQSQQGTTGIERFQEVVNVVPDIRNSKDAKKIEYIRGAISSDHVNFEYPDDRVPVLEDINIMVRPGERIVLVGPPGGGKATMYSLLPRFYDATLGSIIVDGQDIKNVTLQSPRFNIGMVQQDVYLLSGSVYEDTSYGRLGTTREGVIEIAKLVGAREFIIELQGGYDTHVGERGVRLLGGQKQHISIARVFLKDPTILILDEATSALDNKSEYLVSQSLEELTVGHTILTTAHRLTTIQGADRILMLPGNQIAGGGNHEQPLEKEGIYYQLYTTANKLSQGIT